MINYDCYAKKYDERYTSAMCKCENDAIYKALNSIPDFTSKKILDLGCGTGFLLDLIGGTKINTDNYLGIDISSEMIRIANNKYKEMKFVLGDSKNSKEYLNYFEPSVAISLFTIPYIGVETYCIIF